MLHQVWTCSRDSTVCVWKMNKTLGLNSSDFEIILLQQWTTKSPVKSLSLMCDGNHVCGSTFDGSVEMWNIQVWQGARSIEGCMLTMIYRIFGQCQFLCLIQPRSTASRQSLILTRGFGVVLNLLYNKSWCAPPVPQLFLFQY